MGEYKNPKFKPFSVVEPEKEVKLLWDIICEENKKMGIKEIGESSSCFEHNYEFWGTWKVEKPGKNTFEFLKNSDDWPKGIKIVEVKPAQNPDFVCGIFPLGLPVFPTYAQYSMYNLVISPTLYH